MEKAYKSVEIFRSWTYHNYIAGSRLRGIVFGGVNDQEQTPLSPGRVTAAVINKMTGKKKNISATACSEQLKRSNAVGTGCLSCGTTENIGRRKYCSIECRQRLRRMLTMRSGLLKALNTRYAAFYFTEDILILDVLPFGTGEIFSFIYPRSNKKKPADDFCRMADMLGNAWWAERNRTNKKYLASRFVFEQADSGDAKNGVVEPLEIKIPSVKGKSLIRLQLGKSVLDSPELQRIIKAAYRQQAMKHHPDRGGDSAVFIKIHQAYQELIEWSESPSFVKRRGFPDKWFYDGSNNKWVQPTPRQAVS